MSTDEKSTLDFLEIKNFRCFQEISFKFNDKTTVFIAENGGGKTTVLDAIRLSLISYSKMLASEMIEAGKIPYCDFYLDSNDRRHSPVELNTNLSKLRRGLAELNFSVSGKIPAIKPAIAYYGCYRAHREPTPKRIILNYADYIMPKAPYVNCLNAESKYKDLIKWFENSKFDAKAITAVSMSLEVFFSDSKISVKSPRLQEKPRNFVVDFINNGSRKALFFDSLSDGYRMLTALVMDFARRLVQLHPDLPADQVLNQPGIMLIDEVDLHLHPTWQQRVLLDLMRTFPGTQFIVTTHSPQVLSTVDKDSIRIIKWENGVGSVETPKFQTKGVQSADVLSRIMGTDPMPAVPEAKWYNDYIADIENGIHNSPEAQKRWSDLLAHFGESHPLIQDCERLRRFQEFKLRKAQKPEA